MDRIARVAVLTLVLLAAGAAAASAQGRGEGPPPAVPPGPPGGLPPGPPVHVPPPFAATVTGTGMAGLDVRADGATRPGGGAAPSSPIGAVRIVPRAGGGGALVVPCGATRATVEERVGAFLTSLMIREGVLGFGDDGRLAPEDCPGGE